MNGWENWETWETVNWLGCEDADTMREMLHDAIDNMPQDTIFEQLIHSFAIASAREINWAEIAAAEE